ncbi:MAG: MaoC family dehydratase N-terminal domain-containing protein [Proteobacteria bacterium]|nr:MaoC family dehydratase N-terminal domain-containing protein [Pseudomonadota bacterium]
MNAPDEQWKAWLGRSETQDDIVAPARAQALAATLDRDPAFIADGVALPPLWHWLYCLPTVAQADLGSDGHPARGGFLPPVDLPRRMWASSSLQFVRPLAIGAPMRRISTITNVESKTGRSGKLVFVTVKHVISTDGDVVLHENQHIVYRDAPAPAQHATSATRAGPEPARASTWRHTVLPTATLLFRYSALTFNGHRIHYDRPYATADEGYPGLVVHGPLIATLLLDLLHGALPGRDVATFEFRALRPLFDGAAFDICGAPDADGTIALWAVDPAGAIAMEARATVR